MHTYAPYTGLFLHDVHSIALAPNGHVHVLDSSTGSVVYSTTSNEELANKVQKSGEIVAASVDANFKYLVTATSSKKIRVWEVSSLQIISEREAPKKPTDVCFTHDAQNILVSDKFGDVHRYPLRTSGVSDIREESASASSDTGGARKRLTDENLLLGHVSLLTTLLLSKDERYIITADRDEHIRVSWYPESYTIESYCLGHRKFVSVLDIPTWDPSLLISGGGDPELKIWNWMEGKLLHDIPIADVVMPFVKVTRKKPGRDEDGSDGEGGEGGQRISSRAKRRNKKRRKGKEAAEPVPTSDAELGNENEDKIVSMEVDEQQSTEPVLETSPENGKFESTDKERSSEASPLLAVRKITTLELGSCRYVVFSAHGAIALFYFKFPDTPDFSPEVRSISLGQPVLDFAQWPSGNEIWVAVDGNWSEVSSTPQNDPKFIRIVKVVGDELILGNESTHQSLADSLNTSSRIEASNESLRNIDLYSALVVLPKNLDVEHNAMDSEAALSEATTKQLSGKELGRLKTKKAVIALQAAERQERVPEDVPPGNRSLKRQKSESEVDIA